MNTKPAGWLSGIWRWTGIIKAVAQNAVFTTNKKNTDAALISPQQQDKYIVFMMDPDERHRAQSAQPQLPQQLTQAPLPSHPSPADKHVQDAKPRDGGVWGSMGLLIAVVLVVLMMALLWYYPALIAIGGGMALDAPVAKEGYGVTPVMAKVYNDLSFQDEQKRRGWRKVETARGYLRGSRVAPFLKKVQRNWRQKLYRAKVSNAGSEHEHDLTMTLPYENLSIVPNAAGGDCLFLCWQRMLRGMGVDTSTHELRQVVANSLTQQKFDFLKGVFDAAVKEADSGLVSDYSFMHNLGGVEDLRAVVMQSSYFGDEMALSALEKKYNIRCVVLLLVDHARISLARRFSDEEDAKPRYGILLLDQSMLHYELVEYFDQAVMKQDELPEKIQSLLYSMENENNARDDVAA
jgi:hypothetical protein